MNCMLCMIPVSKGVKLCNDCIRYLNSLDDQAFAEIAVRVFGKKQKEADEWLEKRKKWTTAN